MSLSGQIGAQPWARIRAGLATAALLAGAGALALGLSSCATVPEPPALPDQAQYLAQGSSPWQPEHAQRLAELQPQFVVDLQGRGTHRSIQAAIDAAPHAFESSVEGRMEGRQRTVIVIRPGYYAEALCIRNKAPLLLRGTGLGPTQVRIALSRYSGLAKPTGQPAHPCVASREGNRHGLQGSTTAAIFSDDVVLMNLTIANEASEPRRSDRADPSPGPAVGLADEHTQAVALTTAGDRIQMEGVHLAGHQNTFLASRRERVAPADAPAPTPARVYVRASRIEGDVDFVSGNATVLISQSVLHSRGDRTARRVASVVLAPSTPAQVPFGFLVTQSRFTADPNVPPASVALGRAWDQDVAPGAWRSGQSPHGQALVRDSVLGPHITTLPTVFAPFSSGRDAPRNGSHGHRLVQTHNTASAAQR